MKTFFNVLKESGIDPKLINLIKPTLNRTKSTKSNIKFKGEIFHPFGIKTRVRQGDGLFPLLFNVVLEKIIRKWRKTYQDKGRNKSNWNMRGRI